MQLLLIIITDVMLHILLYTLIGYLGDTPLTTIIARPMILREYKSIIIAKYIQRSCMRKLGIIRQLDPELLHLSVNNN